MNLTHRLRRLACTATAVAFVFGGTVCAQAQTVLFDFGNNDSNRGLSVPNPDPLGHYWNSFRTGTFNQNLIDINNQPTTIDFGFSTPVGTDSYNGPAGPTSEATKNVDVLFTDVDQAALGNLGGALQAPFDFVAGPGFGDNKVRFEIQQLDPLKKYTLTFFGSHAYSVDDTTIYSVYTNNTYSTLVATTSLEIQTPGSPQLHNRDKVAKIVDVSPQVDNILYVEFVGANGHEGYLNDLQLTATTVLAGDFDKDGSVDADDLTVWKTSYHTTALGDADGDGDSDGNDFLIWQRNVGASGAVVAAAAVPEPAGIVLLLASLMVLPAARRRA